MKNFLIALAFILVPFQVHAQQLTKKSMVVELKDIGTLLAASSFGCGDIEMSKVQWFMGLFNAFMLDEGKSIGLTIDNIKDYQIDIFSKAYVTVDEKFDESGCYGINSTIKAYDATTKVTIAPTPYFYYTPLMVI